MIATVKEKLHEYIDFADDNKVQAIYTLIENEIKEERSYDEDALNTFRQTSKDYASGKIKGYPVEESMQRIRKQLKK